MPLDDEPVGTTLLFENDACRVWHLELAPGEATPWHTHHSRYCYVVTRPGSVYTELQDGTVECQDDSQGVTVYRKAGDRHRLVSTGRAVYENIIVELKELS